MTSKKSTIREEAEMIEQLVEDSLFSPDENFPISQEVEQEFKGLDLVVMEPKERQELVGKPDTENNIDDDYEYVRNTYQHIIDQGKQTLKSVLEMAKNAPDPRTFEVANNLMKVIADNTDKLLKMQKDYKELKKTTTEIPSTQNADTINNNTIFNGSLQELLAEMEEEGITVIDVES